MKTSVVIPTRNRGSVVLAAVKSALAAAGVDEVVVADGGSTDGSLDRILQLEDPRLRVIEGDWPNAAATRNAGAAASSGEVVAFLDSDDLMLENKVTRLLPKLERDPTVGLVHGRMAVIDEGGAVLEGETQAHLAQIDEGERRGTSYPALADYCAMYTSATIVRRSAFEAVDGYDESLDVYEDWDFYLRLAQAHRLAYAPPVVMRYRLWRGNVSWRSTAEWTAHVAEKHLADLPELPPAQRRAAQYAFLTRLASSNHVLVRTGEARRAALAALRLDPARAVAEPKIRGPLLRSFLPNAVLRQRRPA